MDEPPRWQPRSACSPCLIPKTCIVSGRGLVLSFLAICTGLVCFRSAFYELHVAAVAPGRPGEHLSGSGDEGSSSSSGARRAGDRPSKEEEEEKPKSETAGAPGAPGAARSTSPREEMLRRRAKLKLNLPTRVTLAAEMAPTVKHSCLQRFSELLSSVPVQASLEVKAEKFVDAIVTCGIKVVAADFDYTILSIHTGGGWPVERLAELQGKLSFDFIAVGKELNRRNIPIYVVTFSDPQDHTPDFGRIGAKYLVEEAIRVNGNPFIVAGIIAMRPDLNSDPARYHALGLDKPPQRNKSYHIHRVSEETGVEETAILLIDDDRINAVQHFRKGGLSVWVKGQGFSFDNIEMQK